MLRGLSGTQDAEIKQFRVRFRITWVAAVHSRVGAFLAVLNVRFDTPVVEKGLRVVSGAEIGISGAKSVISGISVFRFGAILVRQPLQH